VLGEQIEKETGYVISHAGILGKDRKPDMLFKVLKDLGNEMEGFKDKLKIKFAGPVEECIRESIRENGLEDSYIETGNIPRKEALKMILSSSVLLLPVNKADNAKGRIPGKLFEYLRAGNPILCFGPTDGDVAKIIDYTKSGKTYAYDDYVSIKEFIKDTFYNKQRNIPVDISEFTNESQTRIVAGYLDEMVSVKNY